METAIVVYVLFSLTIPRTVILYITITYNMPIQASRFDHILTIMLFILFVISFFIWSRWGDLHYCTNPDPAKESDINMAVYIIPLFLIYELFTIYLLDGRPRLREIDKQLMLLKLKLIIRKKLQETKEDYRRFRSK